MDETQLGPRAVRRRQAWQTKRRRGEPQATVSCCAQAQPAMRQAAASFCGAKVHTPSSVTGFPCACECRGPDRSHRPGRRWRRSDRESTRRASRQSCNHVTAMRSLTRGGRASQLPEQFHCVASPLGSTVVSTFVLESTEPWACGPSLTSPIVQAAVVPANLALWIDLLTFGNSGEVSHTVTLRATS